MADSQSTQQTVPGRLRAAALKRLRAALADYPMLSPGEEVMVGISGKDSLTLTWLLLQLRPAPRLFPVHVDAGFAPGGTTIRTLGACLERWGLPLHVISINVVEEVGSGGKRPCFLCTRRRREAMLRLADSRGIRTVALGHKEDDFAETLLLNVLFSRELSCMHPRQPLFQGKFHLVRPLCYVDGRTVSRLVKALDIPVVPPDCPHAVDSQRGRIRNFLDDLRRDHPDVMHNAFLAMGRVRPEFLPKLPGRLTRGGGAGGA